MGVPVVVPLVVHVKVEVGVAPNESDALAVKLAVTLRVGVAEADAMSASAVVVREINGIRTHSSQHLCHHRTSRGAPESLTHKRTK